LATTARRQVRLTGERLFYSGMALLFLAIVVIGFAPTWFLRGTLSTTTPLKPLTPLVLLHGTLFTTWILLFVTQAGLIWARRRELHVRLGIATVALGATMVVVGLMTAAWDNVQSLPVLPPQTNFAFPFFDIMAFAALLVGGTMTRHDAQTHKRLMLCATAVMLQPAVARLHFIPTTTFLGYEITTVIAFLLAIPLLAWDFVQRRRPHVATLVGLGILGGEQLLRLALWENESWLKFAGWIVRKLSGAP
jgi:hypothetical protein